MKTDQSSNSTKIIKPKLYTKGVRINTPISSERVHTELSSERPSVSNSFAVG